MTSHSSVSLLEEIAKTAPPGRDAGDGAGAARPTSGRAQETGSGRDARPRSISLESQAAQLGWTPGWRPRLLTKDLLGLFRAVLVTEAAGEPAWAELRDDSREALATVLLNFSNKHGKSFAAKGWIAEYLPTGRGRGRQSKTGHVTEKTVYTRLKPVIASNLLHDPIKTAGPNGQGANVYSVRRDLVERGSSGDCSMRSPPSTRPPTATNSRR